MRKTRLRLILAVLIIFSMLSCFNKSGPSAPVRHSNIPANTTWAGGVDGGEWYQVVSVSENIFRIKAYNDFTGELETDDSFVVHSNCDVKNLDSAMLVQNLRGYDGKTIYLEIMHNDRYCSLEPATTMSTKR